MTGAQSFNLGSGGCQGINRNLGLNNLNNLSIAITQSTSASGDSKTQNDDFVIDSKDDKKFQTLQYTSENNETITAAPVHKRQRSKVYQAPHFPDSMT